MQLITVPELEPKFVSTPTSFFVTLYNLNYNVPIEKSGVSDENQLFDGQKPVVSSEKEMFETLLFELKSKKSTKETVIKLFAQFGFDSVFARADIMKLAGITSTPAGELIKKLKEAELIEAVSGQGKGKYKFVVPKE